MNNQNNADFRSALVEDARESRNTCVLAIGNVEFAGVGNDRIPSGSNIRIVDIDRLDRTMLNILQPELVVTPLVCTKFDCLDVAHKLYEFEYDGAFRAVVENVPDPSIIRKEVQSVCPGLDFDVTRSVDPRAALN